MADLKLISKNAIPAALEKANHYRLLNQPWQAESICRDILQTEPSNQKVIYALILSITDQFEKNKFKTSLSKAMQLAKQLTDQYQQEYCTGLIYERQAMAAINRSTPRAGYIAFEYIQRAMIHYENAEKIRPESNDESILRWNACVRFIQKHKLKPAPDEKSTEPFLDV